MTRLIFMLACAGLMVLVLALAVSAQVPVRANPNIIKVPDDYLIIQRAIDAAAPGDEIWVAEGLYYQYQSLSITKGITLSGGWNKSFTSRTPGTSDLLAVGELPHRVISVTCPTSDTVVTIDGFSLSYGNATGSGGGPEGLSAAEDRRWGAETAPAADPLTPAERLARLQADLTSAVERGLYPGGSAAYRSMLERVQQQITRLEQARSQPRSSEVPSPEGIDCGGGIYSWNASLHLLNSTISSNVGSQVRDGRGGGVCVGQSAPGGVLIRGNTLLYNIASAAANSIGVGGGLYAHNTPGIVIEGNVFEENGAASGGKVGVGGGLTVEASAGVVVRDNKVLRNTASSSWDPSGAGEGGGAALSGVIGASIAHNKFQENLAGVHGTGLGGALYVTGSGLVTVSDNDVIGNWGCMFQIEGAGISGGGISLIYTKFITVTGNVIEENKGVVSNSDIGTAYGGGLDAESSQHIRVADNEFSGNVASLTFVGNGGGASLYATNDSEVAGNSFVGNVGSLAQSAGSGGGLYLVNTERCRVTGNTFRDNLASAGGEGFGGGLCVAEMGPYTLDTTVDANLFLDNRAAADLASPLESVGGACSFISDGLAFTNNVVAGNSAGSAGGVVLASARGGTVTNNTLAGNSGAGVLVDVYNETPITFTNNIVVSHTVGISVALGVTATVDYTLWHGNEADIAGEGLVNQSHPVTGNPAFVDPAADNYRLTVVSAARDAGDPAGVPPAPDHDADGVSRPQGPAVDLGANEWKGHWLHLPLLFR